MSVVAADPFQARDLPGRISKNLRLAIHSLNLGHFSRNWLKFKPLLARLNVYS